MVATPTLASNTVAAISRGRTPADLMVARQVGQEGTQARASAVRQDVRREVCPGQFSASGAAAAMGLIFGDLGGQLGQLSDLVPQRWGIIWAGLGCQRAVATAAGVGQIMDNLVEAFGGPADREDAGVSGLATPFTAGGSLDHGLGGLWRVSGGR